MAAKPGALLLAVVYPGDTASGVLMSTDQTPEIVTVAGSSETV